MSKSETIHREVNFEEYITNKLAEQGTWQISNNDKGFDANTALVMNDFVEYLKATAPDKLKIMQSKNPTNWLKNLQDDLVKQLENKGTVSVLRDGIQVVGYGTIDCSGHYPDDVRLAKQKTLYDANILRCMRQVHYQTAGNKSLDLVFFINGIPVATAELKTELTQSVEAAIAEYQIERKPIEDGTRRKNYLLMYKRGAIVHFAISEEEIYMCTNLEPEKPKFLPFNLGNNGHAGNPDAPKDDYKTWYFWNIICKKDNWLKIFQNFIYEEVKRKEDATGKSREVRTQIFPRYHQFNCVTKCIDDVKANGVGQKYLIEHSAGSGKTATISWIAHELIRLRDDKGNKTFSSVIVVTNRKVLDNNIKANIKQLKKTVGLIASIGGDDIKKTSGAKSKELAKALENKSEIIVVTLQTFPFAIEAIAYNKKLVGCNFAILIDEAHSGQSGNDAGKMKAALKLAAAEKKKEKDTSDVTTEEMINAYFKEVQASREMPNNVSFFAFTATPKAETKTLFGRPSGKLDDKTGKPIPESFDLYPMRQAIEEGYILDVLKGYMPYETAYKLKEDIVPDTMVDNSTAVRTIAIWQKMHPTNVMAKTQFIIEHFIKNVAPMLNGDAKAMIVTASRASVIRYKYAFEEYLKTHPEIDASKITSKMTFKVLGEPLVAFSGTVHGKDAILPEDEEVVNEFDYLKENPFAQIKKDYDYTESNMNDIGYQKIESAFDKRENRFLIVADKFQTGFDQPQLCAMYIDKKIANDIEIVQTYSRLNRIASGKDKVFIVDFTNDPETVLRAFKKYDNGAEMEHAQSLDIIYQIRDALDSADIYDRRNFEVYKTARYESIKALEAEKDTYRKKLYATVAEPADRWNDAYKAEQTAFGTWKNVLDTAKEAKDKDHAKHAQNEIDDIQAGLDKLIDFREKLKRYISAYDFISQIINLNDPDLEVFYGFAKLLLNRIKGTPLEDIDVRCLVLTDFRINSLDMQDGGKSGEENVEPAVLRPMGAGKKGKAGEKKSLKEIISKINEIWGDEIDVATGARTLNAIVDIVNTDDVSRIQICNSTNSRESVIAEGRLEGIIKTAAATLKQNDFSELADKILKDPQTWKPMAEIVFDLVNEKKHVDVSEVARYEKKVK